MTMAWNSPEGRHCRRRPWHWPGGRLVLSLLLAPTFMLAGCIPGERAPRPTYWVLNPLPGVAEQPRFAIQLSIAAPAVPLGMAHERIAVRLGEQRLDYLADARWIAPLPTLLQHYLHRSLANRLLCDAVAPDGDHGARRFQLDWTLREWAVHYPHEDVAPRRQAAPQLRLEWLLSLREGDPARPQPATWHKRFAASRRAPANRKTALVSTWQALLQETTAQAAAALRAHWRARGIRPGCPE